MPTETLMPETLPGQASAASDERLSTLLSAQGDAVVEAPTFVQVYISGSSGFGAHGLLKSVSRGGLQVLIPVPVTVRTSVQVTVSGCEPVTADVFYCVKKNAVYQVGIVLRARPKPELVVGGFVVMNELDEPFTVSRGHIVDIAHDSVSILCKTAIKPDAWIRLESNRWVLFGEVKDVVATSMLASCVSVHLDAAFRARATAGLHIARAAGAGSQARSSYGY